MQIKFHPVCMLHLAYTFYNCSKIECNYFKIPLLVRTLGILQQNVIQNKFENQKRCLLRVGQSSHRVSRVAISFEFTWFQSSGQNKSIATAIRNKKNSPQKKSRWRMATCVMHLCIRWTGDISDIPLNHERTNWHSWNAGQFRAPPYSKHVHTDCA